MKTSEVYKKLYHYTTWNGLSGILNNQSLRATHYKFLNDTTEISLFAPRLIKFLHPYVLKKYNELLKESPSLANAISEAGGLDAVAEHYVEAIYYTTSKEFYITSFCGIDPEDKYINDNGLLSQWRGYGKDGGFAVMFDTQKLEERLRLEYERFDYIGFILADIVYSDNEEKFKSELSAQIHDIAEYLMEGFWLNMKQIKEGGQIDENPPLAFVQRAQDALPAFVQCVSRYKHRGFKEENEVRIVAMPLPQEYRTQEYLQLAEQDAVRLKPDKKREFREKNGELIPFIELFNSPDIVLPIEKIIVGPHKEKEGRAAALHIMLRNIGIEGIDITVSDIPYIG